MTAGLTHVRALVLGVVLGDVTHLGADPTTLQEEIFRTRNPYPQQSAHDRLVARRLNRSFGQALQGLVDQAFEDAESNSLKLVISLSASASSVGPLAPPAFPVHVFAQGGGSVKVTPERSTPWDAEVADCHLHSGASIALADLVDLMVMSPHPLGSDQDAPPGTDHMVDLLKRTHASDSQGNSFCLAALMGATRAQFARFLSPGTCLTGKPISAELFEKGQFWKEAASVVREFGGDRSFLEELVTSWDISNAATSPLGGLVARLPASHVAGASEQSELLGVLGALNVLHGVVESIPGEGLTRFVDRFDRMSLLRDLGAGPDRKQVIATAARNVFASTNVVGAEFRKTIPAVGRSSRQLEDAIRGTVVDHLVGISSFSRKEGNRPLRLAVPVGFVRERRRPAPDAERWVARYPLSETATLSNALGSALTMSPGIRNLVTGVDVAGDEGCMPNWPFLACYEALQIAGHDGLRFSVHAGESFSWRLQGLRRIGECLSSTARVDAIGHCLALDDDLGLVVAGEVTTVFPLLEVFSDLSWLIANDIAREEVQEFLRRVIRSTALGVYGVEDPNVVVSGYKLLHSLAGLQHAHMCEVSHGSIEFLNHVNNWDVSQLERDAQAAWLFAYEPRGLDPLGGALDEHLIVDFLSLAEKVEVDVRGCVLDKMRTAPAVVVESCPTSNLRLAHGMTARPSHVRRFKDLGLDVTVSSDDPIVFGTNVSSEFGSLAPCFTDAPELLNEISTLCVDSCSASPVARDADEFSSLADELSA